MNRRRFLRSGAAAGLAAAAAPLHPDPRTHGRSTAKRIEGAPPFELEEMTIADLQDGLSSGRYTARRLVELYLERIEAVDRQGPALHHVLEINPDAFEIAGRSDAERRENGPRGPMHGIPVIVKDNIDTADRMSTTAGSLALYGTRAPRDAFLVRQLREAGAILLAKTNLSEWANFRSTRSSSGWSGVGGQGRNPYALDRSPCGSSSGTGGGVSANYAAAGVGTETDGSVVCPSSHCSIVGIKPTLGLISRSGIVPIAHSQDTAGAMARTVEDAAILLGVLTGEDLRDPATASSRGHAPPDYTPHLDSEGLSGARIGVARSHFGYSEEADRIAEDAVDVMKQLGAVIVDPADIPHAGEYDDSEFEVLLYEFKADLNAYLSSRGQGAPVSSLADLIEFNERNREREMPYFGQEIFHMAQEKGPLSDQAYRDALAKNHRLSRDEGIDALMNEHRLDAVVAPTNHPAWPIDLVNGDHYMGSSSTPAAVAGYPNVTVPAGYSFGLPVGISFIGRAWSEAVLIRLAYAFEQATMHRVPPRFLPTVQLQS